ncbi:hypothetical protein T07_14140 [Trichinella nelsoni]|uniref:Uncharacterized protein n=1 Tax=Trichinella nelsoni TaxID=6336 RepID=A0A0V0S3S8_9BILA|nr:hypothetical protein T07_14140 [Trichinella nelsoni]
MRFTARHDRSIRSSYPTDDRMELVELVVRLCVQSANSNKSRGRLFPCRERTGFCGQSTNQHTATSLYAALRLVDAIWAPVFVAVPSPLAVFLLLPVVGSIFCPVFFELLRQNGHQPQIVDAVAYVCMCWPRIPKALSFSLVI